MVSSLQSIVQRLLNKRCAYFCNAATLEISVYKRCAILDGLSVDARCPNSCKTSWLLRLRISKNAIKIGFHNNHRCILRTGKKRTIKNFSYRAPKITPIRTIQLFLFPEASHRHTCCLPHSPTAVCSPLSTDLLQGMASLSVRTETLQKGS